MVGELQKTGRDEIAKLLHELPGLADEDFDEISSSGDGHVGNFAWRAIERAYGNVTHRTE